MGMETAGPGVRVLVVDDSVSFREVAREVLDSVAGFVWIGEACSGEDGIEQTLRLRPDLVLMDVHMPGIGGIEAASQIVAQLAPPPVVVLITADFPEGVPGGQAADILGKHRLNRESLRRLWEVHGPLSGSAAVAV